MPLTREQLDRKDADRAKMRADTRRRAQIQEIADLYRIPFYLRPDGSVHQRPPGECFVPADREPEFDSVIRRFIEEKVAE